MKAIKLTAILFLFILLFSQCEKAEDIVPYKMTAEVNGEEWKTRVAAAEIKDGFFIIVGTATNGTIIEVTIKGTTPGTYELTASLEDPKAQCLGLYKESISSETNDIYTSVEGTVVLSEVNTPAKQITGTFSFPQLIKGDLSLETMSITNGVFDKVKYVEK